MYLPTDCAAAMLGYAMVAAKIDVEKPVGERGFSATVSDVLICTVADLYFRSHI
jgi:hypothetical protein